MRLKFRTLTRPKHLAERLQVAFPVLSHMQAQEWAAGVAGYRDWHELSRSVGPGVQETPDWLGSLDDNDAKARAYVRRRDKQREVLQTLAGQYLPGMEVLFRFVDPNCPAARYKKLGTTGKGTPAFVGLSWDLYPAEGEDPVHGMGGVGSLMGEDTDAHVYCGVPEGSREQDFIDELIDHIERKGVPYPEYPGIVRECLSAGPFARSGLRVEREDEDAPTMCATQERSQRYFRIEDGKPTGFIVVTTMARAESDNNEIELKIEVTEAWCPSAVNEDTFDDLMFTIAVDLEMVLKRLLWFCVGNPDARVHVVATTESEMPLAWRVAEEIVEWLRGDIVDNEGKEFLDVVSFDVDM